MSGTVYVIISVYNKEKRLILKNSEKCNYCGCVETPKFIIEKITHNENSYSSQILKICIRSSQSFFTSNSKLLIPKNMSKKLKNFIEKKDVSKYKKLCSYI